MALTTVSRAYSDASKLSPVTLRRIESAAAELGYTVNLDARSLRRKSSGQLLVLLPDIGNPFFSLVLKGLEEGVREGGRLLPSPVVALSERVDEPGVPFVGIDNARAARWPTTSRISATPGWPRSRGPTGTA